MAWKTFELPGIPADVTSAVDGVKTALDTAATALTVVKDLVKALSAATSTSVSASQASINVAVAAIETAVKSLTEDTGIYILLVPPRSVVVIPEAVKAALSPTIAITPTTHGLNTQAMFAGETVTTQEADILQGLFSATGGNAGFVRTVTESFDDIGDANRPVLGADDAVAGIYIVAGASNIASLIPFTNGISSMFSAGKPTTLDAPASPSPQNLRAKFVAGSAVLLQWDFQSPLSEIPALGTFALITEVAVIRSTSITLLSASTPQELFGSSTLSEGMKTADGLTAVVAVLPYATTGPTTYLDSSEHTPGKAYYYAVSFHVSFGTSSLLLSGDGADLNFVRLSNASKVYLSKEDHGTPRSIVGTPPDWYRTARTIDLLPAAGALLNQVTALSAQLGATAVGYGDLLKTNVTLLEQQINGYADLAIQLTSALSSLLAISSINLGTVSSRAFSGTGGTDFVKKDLVQAFGDTSDPNRPPFDGDEFVAGVVLLATTPNAVTLLEKIMGSINSGASAIAAALEKIDVELATLESIVFNADLTAHAATPVQSSTVTDFSSLVGESASYCYHSYEPSVTFDSNFNPI